MMGGLGRTIDGSYAEYTVVDAAVTISFETDLGWDIVCALPEMLQTAHGSLTAGLQLQAGQQVLIHGGTSTVGLAAIAIAHQLGVAVIATTRNAARADLLHHVGADHVVTDNDTLPGAVRATATEGLDAVLEFLSTAALPDMPALARSGGVVCFVGALSSEWIIPDISPFAQRRPPPSYAGEAADLSTDALSRYLGAIEAETMRITISDTYC